METVMVQGGISDVYKSIDNFNEKMPRFDAVKQVTAELWTTSKGGYGGPDFKVRVIEGFKNDVCYLDYRVDISSHYMSGFSGLIMSFFKQNGIPFDVDVTDKADDDDEILVEIVGHVFME
jgi:hypothetical protein